MLTVKFFEFNPIMENTYILYNETGQCCIIDPGCYYEAERQILKNFIEEKNLSPIYLLNTHCHLDHVFGNKFVSETWGLPLFIHETEKNVLSFAPKSAELYGLPFDNYNDEMIYLEEGDIIKIGDDELKVLFTPGHSPGSISFYNEKGGFLISGDVLFSGSIGRTDLPGGDFDTLERSIKTQLYVLPDTTKVYPGHGGGTSIGFEKKNNPFVQAD